MVLRASAIPLQGDLPGNPWDGQIEPNAALAERQALVSPMRKGQGHPNEYDPGTDRSGVAKSYE
jgi:hypothetical protein